MPLHPSAGRYSGGSGGGTRSQRPSTSGPNEICTSKKPIGRTDEPTVVPAAAIALKEVCDLCWITKKEEDIFIITCFNRVTGLVKLF